MGASVTVEGVSKRFRLAKERATSLKERFVRFGRIDAVDFWALRDIDLEIAQGETVGLLGHNGSGKSTLMKCIAGTMRPTEGRVATAGRVAALLELGAGFHPELSGRENVYLNGSILGLSKAEVDRVFDEVVDFAELAPFIDQQVKHYSSGMYARLGFAVAVNVDPDVLLVDEVLAVGDEAFQRKCLDRIKQFQRDGRTIVVVTHSADLVRQVCDRAMVLDHGRSVMTGHPGEAVRAFRETLLQHGMQIPDEAKGTAGWRLNLRVRITGAAVEPDSLEPGDPLRVVLRYDAPERVDDVVFAMEVHDQDGNRLLGTNTDLLGARVDSVEGAGEVVFAFDAVPLLDGSYDVSLGVHTHDGGVEYDHREGVDRFTVTNPGRMQGRVHFPLHAEHRPASTRRG